MTARPPTGRRSTASSSSAHHVGGWSLLIRADYEAEPVSCDCFPDLAGGRAS
jgi:hypothetical protein